VDHRGFCPPWIDHHGQLDELIEAQPKAALGHGGLPQLHGEDEELAGVRFRASPEAEEPRGDQTMVVKRRRCSVRVVLGCGENRIGVGRGLVWNGVLEVSFYRADRGVPRR
jgi:hypothetical protein